MADLIKFGLREKIEVDEEQKDKEYEITCEIVSLPSLSSDRYNHSSFVIGDHLFAVFGKNTDIRYNCNEADWINLKRPDAKFEEIKVVNKAKNLKTLMFENTMMFEPLHEDQ
jgi:hypothetical protein